MNEQNENIKSLWTIWTKRDGSKLEFDYRRFWFRFRFRCFSSPIHKSNLNRNQYNDQRLNKNQFQTTEIDSSEQIVVLTLNVHMSLWAMRTLCYVTEMQSHILCSGIRRKIATIRWIMVTMSHGIFLEGSKEKKCPLYSVFIICLRGLKVGLCLPFIHK